MQQNVSNRHAMLFHVKSFKDCNVVLKVIVTSHLLMLLRTVEKHKIINPPMAEGVGCSPHPNRFSSFSREWEEVLFQAKYLARGSSLGHLSMKKFFRSDLLSWP